eukprot:scaffold143748_cov38-Prasinocladus_malaysianus.AAC.1
MHVSDFEPFPLALEYSRLCFADGLGPFLFYAFCEESALGWDVQHAADGLAAGLSVPPCGIAVLTNLQTTGRTYRLKGWHALQLCLLPCRIASGICPDCDPYTSSGRERGGLAHAIHIAGNVQLLDLHPEALVGPSIRSEEWHDTKKGNMTTMTVMSAARQGIWAKYTTAAEAHPPKVV